MGLVNFRDLGGLAAGGATTRADRLMRSAAPRAGDAPDQAPFDLVVDLRCRSEHEADQHPFAAATTVLAAPFVSEEELAWAQRHTGHIDVPAWYVHALDTYGERLAEAALACIDADGPVLVHCAAGKDRTGLLVALLLRLAGVDADAVEADYLRTNEHRVERLGVERGPVSTPALAESIRAALSHWEGAGGVEAWFLDRAGTPEAVLRWRATFLEAPAAAAR